MTDTFDIRFVRPVGSFHWRGAGRLRIDSEGTCIAARRGLSGLLAGSRRIAAGDLRGVTREGEAIRIEYSSGNATLGVLPFRAGDRATAERIVRLLPTTSTVELDHETPPPGKAFRIDWRVAALLGVLFGAAGAVLVVRSNGLAHATPLIPTHAARSAPAAGTAQAESGNEAAAEVAQTPREPMRALPEQARQPTGRYPRTLVPSRDARTAMPVGNSGASATVPAAAAPILIVQAARAQAEAEIEPFIAGTPEFDIARRAVEDFYQRAADLLEAQRRASMDSRAAYADALEALEQDWWVLTFDTLDRRDIVRGEFRGLRRALLSSARHERAYLLLHATAVRTGDPRYDGLAREELAESQLAFARALAYVW
jgi:hypothetical protein